MTTPAGRVSSSNSKLAQYGPHRAARVGAVVGAGGAAAAVVGAGGAGAAVVGAGGAGAAVVMPRAMFEARILAAL